jgi:hypothetical protein
MKNLNIIKNELNKINNNNKNQVNLLKDLLLLLNNKRLNNSLNNKYIWNYLNELSNKGVKLQHLNNMNTWSSQIYKFNKNEEININIYDRLVTKLLTKLLTININNNIFKLIISKPIFEHNINKVNIKFFYYISNNNKNNNINNDNNKLINRLYNNYKLSINDKLINLLNNNLNSISNILSLYYQKDVSFEPIQLKYNYMNSDILAKSLRIMNSKRSLSMNKIKNLINNMPKLNDKLISQSYINNINNIMFNKYNNIITSINNNNDNDKLYNIVYNNQNIESIAMNILMYKYLVGLSIQLKGRLSSNKSISRSNTMNILKGTFNNYKTIWGNRMINTYKLNYIPVNHNITNISDVNKNGKYNIKVKLNTI